MKPGEVTMPVPPCNQRKMALRVLSALMLTFVLVRIVVYLIMTHTLPDLYLYIGATHVHHLNFGIFLLSGTGAYLIFGRPEGRNLRITAVAYGVGLGLTFDEFGMWLHLGGSYWQRASFDAIVVIASLLGLVAVAPSLKWFRPRHWVVALLMAVAAAGFGLLLVRSMRDVERKVLPRLEELEAPSPTSWEPC